MQFMVSVIHDGSGAATADEMSAIGEFNARLRDAGHWVLAGGLATPSSAVVIDNRVGRGLFTDGPFVETKEYIAGFWVIEAPDLDDAVALAAEGSLHCNRRVEVRALL